MIIKESVSRLALSKEEQIYKTSGFNYPRNRSIKKVIAEKPRTSKSVKIVTLGSV
jgi:hypothetical protein